MKREQWDLHTRRWDRIELGIAVALIVFFAGLALVPELAHAEARTAVLRRPAGPHAIAERLVGRDPDFVSMCDRQGCDGWAYGARRECWWQSQNLPTRVRVTAYCVPTLRTNQ